MADNGFEAEGARVLAPALQTLTVLTLLDLSGEWARMCVCAEGGHGACIVQLLLGAGHS